ncbi:MAG TPA: hypothetical protein VNA88_06500 [Candidatus Kapabacteria bacterium]|jgi:hypothetical protein|nr:hypothetical protein [Candidatus Kapabacteria bacterium]
MNTSNYDRIIDQYLDGALSPVEEREFRNLLEIDADLRSLFEAELAVRATLEEDAEAIPVETERSYARFLAALAATGPATGGDGASSAAGSSPRGAGGWIPAGVAKLAGAVVVTLGLAGAGWYALGLDDDADQRATPSATTSSPSAIERPAAGTAPSATGGTSAGTGLGSQTHDAPAIGAPQARRSQNMTPERPLAPGTATTRQGTTSAAEASRAGAVARPETKALVDPHDDLTEIDHRSGAVDDLPIIESDSVDTRVRFKNRAR